MAEVLEAVEEQAVDPAEQEAAEVERLRKLQSFADSLAEKRREAVDGKKEDGIERQWDEDDEYYNGVDESNKGEAGAKGKVLNAPMQTPSKKNSNKSTAFVNITQPYVDMASAQVADMLLPTDGDKPFALLPTPVPDVMESVASTDQIDVPMPDGSVRKLIAGEVAKMMVEKARKSAEGAEKRIWDWLVEAQWHGEVRKVIEDAARIGTGVLKGPYPVKKSSTAIDKSPDGEISITKKEKLAPASCWIDPRNFFPDPACGENIQDGSYTWERDTITAKKLRELKEMVDQEGNDAYLNAHIDACLKEGPNREYETGQKPDKTKNDRFEIWYFHGMAEKENLEAAGCECEEDDVVPVIVTMVNDRVIKVAMSPLDSGDFPYDVMIWQRVRGKWWGSGVARQVRTAQRGANAATRRMMNNAGLASGIQFVIRDGVITPADGSWELTPDKVWKAVGDKSPEDVKNAFTTITIPSRQKELRAIIDFWLEIAERVTSMPLMMQGQQGHASETVGGMTILQNNASTVRRRVAKIFDDKVTEPHIRRYYEWLLLHGPEKSEKEEYTIDARGSTALFERDAQNQAILQMGQLVKDPAFDIDPAKWIVEAFKAQKLDPARFQLSDEQKAERDKAMQEQGPPVDPRAQAQKEVAQIRAEGDIKKATLVQQSDMAEIEARNAEAEKQRQHDREMKQFDMNMKMIEFAQERNLSLDEIKASLAGKAMTLRAQERAAATKAKGPQLATPIVEPPGRAPAGEAFQR